ncbi:hypothetical protein FKM82_010095 [Ascaphus truei]
MIWILHHPQIPHTFWEKIYKTSSLCQTQPWMYERETQASTQPERDKLWEAAICTDPSKCSRWQSPPQLVRKKDIYPSSLGDFCTSLVIIQSRVACCKSLVARRESVFSLFLENIINKHKCKVEIK